MKTIACERCSEEKEGLAELPVGGELGKTIVERVCSDCWDQWREMSAQLINHHGLNLGNPSHRQELRRVMKEFLKLEPQPSAE